MSGTVMTTTHGSLRGRRFWVVGGADGLGTALADELRSRGSRVAVSSLRQDALVLVRGRQYEPVGVDLGDGDDVARAAERVRENLGGLDGLVFAAGAGRRRVAPEEVDVLGLGHLLAAVLPDLVRQRDGHVVGVAAGARRGRRSTANGAALAAQLTVLAAMRAALGAKDVHVTTAVARSGGTRTGRALGFGTPATCRWIVDAVADGRAEVTVPGSRSLVGSALRELPRRARTSALTHAGGGHP